MNYSFISNLEINNSNSNSNDNKQDIKPETWKDVLKQFRDGKFPCPPSDNGEYMYITSIIDKVKNEDNYGKYKYKLIPIEIPEFDSKNTNCK